jgi:alpha-glucosidase
LSGDDAGAHGLTVRIDTPGQQTVRVRRIHDQFTPLEPFYFVAMLQTKKPISVTGNHGPLPLIDVGTDNGSADALMASQIDAYYYNQSLQTTFVKIFDIDADSSIIARS